MRRRDLIALFCGAGSDHAGSANHDPHDVSMDPYRSVEPAQAWFIGCCSPGHQFDGVLWPKSWWDVA
jgi:hypothetical protein